MFHRQVRFRRQEGTVGICPPADKRWRTIFVGEFEDGGAAQELRRIWPFCEIAGHVSKKEVNDILNRSKVSVVYSRENDASPRVIVESLASGTQVMIHKRNIGQKYITGRAGEVVGSLTMRWKLERMLRRYDRYDPVGVYRRFYASEVVARNLWENCFCERQGDSIGSARRASG